MDSRRSIVLTGSMGAGKSTVGRAVAERLARPFVDMDDEIEARVGRTIAEIFADEGEGAFRRHERSLCRELTDRDGLVIATGGGALLDCDSRDRMIRAGTVICLTCAVDELVRRLDGTMHRPLLHDAQRDSSETLRRRIEDLLASRRDVYEGLPWHVDTTARSIDEVLSDVLAMATATTLRVTHPGGSYPIRIGAGLLRFLGDAARQAGVPAGSAAAVVSNDVVFPLYGEGALASLAAAGYRAFPVVVPDGEEHKRLHTVSSIYDRLIASGLDRHGAVVALGGGVAGDMAGYAAATYLRGVRAIQVPTTLLAMVDASIGGKTGVDLPAGKNLVGAFKQPDLVLIDPAVLSTLAPEDVRSGLAEAIKHAIIGDTGLFANLANDPTPSETWSTAGAAASIASAVRVKVDIVEADPFERGRRAALNLGHTVGHALETATRYSIPHGHAVAVGMVAAARLATATGLAAPNLSGRIEAVLESVGLPTTCPYVAVDDLLAAMTKDKKRSQGEIRWVLPRDIGDVLTDRVVPNDVVRDALIGMGARRRR